MQPDEPRERRNEAEQSTAEQFTGSGGSDDHPAWEEIDTGRYMPRRIKGSCKGRALG